MRIPPRLHCCAQILHTSCTMPRHSSAFLRPLTTPSRAFVTFLAAAGFSGALLLTPTAQLDEPLAEIVSAGKSLSNDEEPRASIAVDSATLEREVVDRYDHLPLAQIFRRRASPEIANRVA